MPERWRNGDLVARREVLGLQPNSVTASSAAEGAWFGVPVFIVDDCPEHLVSYIAPGARFGFAEGQWPTPDGLHPWHGREAWEGNGCLMVQPSGDHYAIWHFWDGPDREFVCWYLNLQTAAVRTPAGYDTQDLELDIVVFPDGSHVVKDADLLDDRVAEGRYSAELVGWIRAYGDRLVRRLESEGLWWDQTWADWTPDPEWVDPEPPPRWDE